MLALLCIPKCWLPRPRSPLPPAFPNRCTAAALPQLPSHPQQLAACMGKSQGRGVANKSLLRTIPVNPISCKPRWFRKSKRPGSLPLSPSSVTRPHNILLRFCHLGSLSDCHPHTGLENVPAGLNTATADLEESDLNLHRFKEYLQPMSHLVSFHL